MAVSEDQVIIVVGLISKELHRQANLNQPGTPYVDTDDPERATIDGEVDLIALARAIISGVTIDENEVRG